MFQCSDGNSAQENSSLKRVAVVEDFFDIIYAMHVEMGADPGRAPKHAGQKKTYKAVSKHKQGWVLYEIHKSSLVQAPHFFTNMDSLLKLVWNRAQSLPRGNVSMLTLAT